MATIVNTIDVTLRATTPRLTATAVTISSTASSFLRLKNTSTITPASISLTTVVVGMPAPVYAWYYATSTAPSTWILIGGATTSSYAPSSSTFTTQLGSAGTSVMYKCIITQTGWTTAESYYTVLYVQQANDAVVCTLSKDTILLPCDADGSNTVYTGSTYNIKVNIGSTVLKCAATGANTFSVTHSVTSGTITVGTYTVPSSPGDISAEYPILSGMSSTLAPAVVTYTITVRDVDSVTSTYTKSQTINKSAVGATGAAGATTMYAYQVITNTSLPSSPSIAAGIAPIAGAAVAVANPGNTTSWYASPKTSLATNEWMFQVSGTFHSLTNTYTWTNPSYLSTFKVGKLDALSAKLGSVELDATGNLFSTGKTYGSTNAGVFLGYHSGEYKLDVGNEAGHLRWDGAELDLRMNSPSTSVSLDYTSTLEPVFSVRRTRNAVPPVFISDSPLMQITGVNVNDSITLHPLYIVNTNIYVNDPVIFSSNIANIVSGTIYYVKTVDTVNNTFTISAALGGAVFNITSTVTSNVSFKVDELITYDLISVIADTSGAALDVTNNGSGPAIEVIGGIKFPNTFVDESNPYTLDDYREVQSLTPTVTSTGNTGVCDGMYTKVGRVYSINLTLSFTGTGTGTMFVTLPFTPTISGAMAVFTTNMVTGFNDPVVAWSSAGSNQLEISYLSTTGSIGNDFASKVKTGTDLRVTGVLW